MDQVQTRARFAKVLFGLVGVVFLGAVGSGLWDRALSPAADWASRAVVGALGEAATRYVNHLYSRIGYAQHSEYESNLLYTAFIVVVVVSCLFFLPYFVWVQRRLRRMAPAPNLPVPKSLDRFIRTRAALAVVLLMAAFNVVAYSELLLSSKYTSRTVVWIERSLEIVRPQIADTTFWSLRAQYRSTTDREAFRTLWIRLTAIAALHKIVLPSFTPIGIDGNSGRKAAGDTQ